MRAAMLRHCLYALLLALPLAVSAQTSDSLQIEFVDNRVRLTAHDVELRELLRSLAEQANFKVWISPALPAQMVTADIAPMPVQDALARLLVDNSFALVYGADGAVSALYLLPPGEAQPMQAVVDAETADPGERVLQGALASKAMPDHLKAALLSQHYGESEEYRQSVREQRPQAIRQLLDSLRRLGSPSAETMQRLERTLGPDAGSPESPR